MRTLWLRLGLAMVGTALLAVPLAGAAPGRFVEPATILHTFEGENPGGYFGWAVSEIYSGADGSELLSFVGSAAGEGLGPGREAGDVDAHGHVDLAIGSWTSSDGAEQAGQVEIYSGAEGSLLRRLTSTNAGQNFGFDAVGMDDVNGDGVPDLLASAATGDVVYVIAGETP